MEDIIASKGTQWQGYYEQSSNKSAMTFDKFFIENDVIMGMGKDVVGEFDIEGKVTNGEVYFDKQYRGKHNVIYKGFYDGRVISGSWWIGSYTDKFMIWRADVSPWQGVFYENGTAHKMILELSDQEGQLSGKGQDFMGKFTMSGSFKDDLIQIKKEYLGEQVLTFEGKKIKAGVIKGTYEGTHGPCMFTLQKCEPSQFEKDLANLHKQSNEQNDYDDEYDEQDD